MTDLRSKTALVTGGGTGIGFGIAAKLLAANATVSYTHLTLPTILRV